jgi:hypothetical protein
MRPPLTKILLLVPVLFPLLSGAAEVEKAYYLGEAALSSDTGKSMGSQVILLEKTHDPEHSVIIERAIVAKPGTAPAEEHVMTMTVKDDGFTISDAKNTIHGTGKLFGPAWHWTYFKAEYEATNGARIEDENYMNDPGILVARKKVSGPNGRVFMYMDVALKAVTPETFRILATNLLKTTVKQDETAPLK